MAKSTFSETYRDIPRAKNTNHDNTTALRTNESQLSKKRAVDLKRRHRIAKGPIASAKVKISLPSSPTKAPRTRKMVVPSEKRTLATTRSRRNMPASFQSSASCSFAAVAARSNAPKAVVGAAAFGATNSVAIPSCRPVAQATTFPL
jgi:hypothetical protein